MSSCKSQFQSHITTRKFSFVPPLQLSTTTTTKTIHHHQLHHSLSSSRHVNPDVLRPSQGTTLNHHCSKSSTIIRAVLHPLSPVFGEDPHPNNPFSFDQDVWFESHDYDENNLDMISNSNGVTGSTHASSSNGYVHPHAHDIAFDTMLTEQHQQQVSDSIPTTTTTNTSTVAPVEEENKEQEQEQEEKEKEKEKENQNQNRSDEELFFDGLSYPIDALDWCNTKPDCVKTTDNGDRVCNLESDLHMRRVETSFVETFRMSSPYINAHQGLIFVIHIPGSLLQENMFASVMEDIALMRVVGIKLVLVLGPQGLINKRLEQEGIASNTVNGIRVTDSRTLQVVKELSGSMRFEVECALAKGVTNMPSTKTITAVSGNFYSAQPIGIIDGQDFEYTGKVRRIDVESIGKRLDQGDIIVLPNVGSSPSGQQFNCKAEEVAAECAAQLKAEKLIFMGNGETLYDRRSGHTIPNLSLKTAARYLNTRAHLLPDDFRLSLQCSVSALERGVRRAHILDRFLDGVLLMEVFHRDGVGLMVSRDLYEGFRQATLKDVNGVKAIIRPLEDQGILKRRSRTMLERDIEKFVVIERDGMIIACLSLAIIEEDPTWAELGCVAVHRDYRKLGKGDAMLGFTERMAYDKGVRNLFVLSTQSFDWFHERGFKEVSIDDLPNSRQEIYDRNRRSKIFYKVLQGSRAVRLPPMN